MFVRRVSAAVFALMLFGAALPAALLPTARGQERPSAPKLLPAETLLYLRLRDSQDFATKFSETALGRMGNDEQVKPLVESLYGASARAFEQIEEEIGLSLTEVLSIPQGEVCLALVAEETGPPVLVIMLEAAENMPKLRQLVERGEQLLEENEAAVRVSEKIAGTAATKLTFDDNGRERTLIWLERDNMLLITSGLATTERILAAWDGAKPAGDEEGKTLAENDNFINIMRRCQGSANERPEFTFFIDPVELVRVSTRQNIASAGFMAFVPALGLDGLTGIGGSMILGAEDFDSIIHLHVLLDNPRTGVIEMLALGGGDSTPESWVPADVASYTTLHWEVDRTYATLTRLYDSFRGEGALQAEIENRINGPLEVNFEEEILPQIEGRLSYISWVEPPARINSQATLAGIKLKDAEAFRETLDKIAASFGDRVEKKSFADTTYYAAARPAGVGELPEDAPGGGRLRVDPCMAVVGDYLLLGDRSSILEKVISTKRGGASLADELDYKAIATKLKRQANGTTPGMVTFNRPEEGMRWIYEMVASENTREQLSRRGEENPFLRDVDQALTDNPLPPFAVLSRYLAPGGGMLTNEETGIHYMGFSLRRK